MGTKSNGVQSCRTSDDFLSPMEDHDEDVTFLKSHFDPSGPDVPVQVGEQHIEHIDQTQTIDDLPEHVTVVS